MTKKLPNEQTLQLSSDRVNKIQMHAIRGNNFQGSFYHRGPETSSDTRACRATLLWGICLSAAYKPHATAAIHVRLARLHSICSWVRPKPPRVNPRNACTWHRISSEGLPKSNHTLIQQAMVNTRGHSPVQNK